MIFPVVFTAKQLMFTAASIILVTVCLYSLGVLSKNFLYKILKQGFRASHGRKTRLCNNSLPKLLFSLPPVSGEASLSDTVMFLRQHLQQLRDIFPKSFSLQLPPPQKNQKWGRQSSPSADKVTSPETEQRGGKLLNVGCYKRESRTGKFIVLVKLIVEKHIENR